MALGVEIPDGLTKKEASQLIEDSSDIRVDPEKLAEYQAWKKQYAPDDPTASHNLPATEKQRIELTLYGIEAPPEMTKADAAVLIRRMERDVPLPEEEHSKRYHALMRDYEQREHERLLELRKSQIAGYLDDLVPADLSAQKLFEIQSGLKRIFDDLLEELEQRMETVTEEAEERRNRYKDMLALFGRDGTWGRQFKRPSRAQVESVLAELDRLNPGEFDDDQ
ncbi:MAG: hypothetical protein U0V70_00150 [Terriglobia bacterium]